MVYFFEGIMKTNNLIAVILTLILGVMLIIFRSFFLNVAMSIIGIALIVWAIIDAINHKWTFFVIKLLIGIALIILGWLVTKIILYILAGLILCYAIYQIFLLINSNCKKWQIFVQPALLFLVALLLLLKGFDWAFMIAGLALIVQSGLSLITFIR